MKSLFLVLFLICNTVLASSTRSIDADTIRSSDHTSTYLTFTTGVINANSNKVSSVLDPVSAQDAATKNYVDSVASGLNPKQAVQDASTANIVGTYVNGVAGVGATFTVTATGAFTIDGQTPASGSRILLKDQTSGFQNGVYDLTVAGSVGVSPVLTRSLDYNTASDMNAGDLIPVINGTANSGTTWLQTATITTVGTDSLVFTKWSASAASYLLKSNNLSDVSSASTSFNNISPMTTGGDIIYGGTSGAGTRLANGSNGQVLTSSGGTSAPTWTTPGGSSPSFTYRSVTTTDTAVVTDYSLDLSGSSFTETLFTAVGHSGSILEITHDGTSETNLYTLNTTSGQTIGGIASGSYVLHTNGESLKIQSNGANWIILSHKTESGILGSTTTTITATTTNPTKGTVSKDQIYYTRHGSYARIFLTYIQTAAGAGVAGSGIYKILIPGSLTADTTNQQVNSSTAGITNMSPGALMGTMTVNGGATSGSGGFFGSAILFDSTHFQITGSDILNGTYSTWGAAREPLSSVIVNVSGWIDILISGWQP